MGTKRRKKTSTAKSAKAAAKTKTRRLARAPRSAPSGARAAAWPKRRKRQYDPGLYSAKNGPSLIGVINAVPPNNPEFEVWALSPSWATLGPGATGLNNTVTLASQRQGSPQSSPPWPTSTDLPPSQKPANVFDVYCVTNPTRGTTGTNSGTPAKPQPVAVGHYKLTQSGKRVGELIVEPWGADTRQHWFLCTIATSSSDAPYVAPSAANPNSSTSYKLLDFNVNGINLTNFENNLGFGATKYILAIVTFRTTVT